MSSNTCTIPGNVAAIIVAADSQASLRYTLSGVQISIKDSGYRCICTDGRIAAIVTGPSDGVVADPGEMRCGEPAETAVIDAQDFAALVGYPGKVAIDVDGDEYENIDYMRKSILVSIGQSKTVLATRGGNKIKENLQKREVKNLEGRFPDVLAVMPKDKPVATALVDANVLIRLLKVAAAVNCDDGPGTTLEIYADNGNVTGKPRRYVGVRVKRPDGQELQGILVQLEKQE